MVTRSNGGASFIVYLISTISTVILSANRCADAFCVAENAISPPDDAKPLELADLIRYDADYEPPGTDGAELWQKYDDKCAGCDNMDKSWDKWDKRRYGNGAEPRWRLRGTRQFVCWRCYEQVEHGTLTTLRYHKQ